MRIYEYHDLPDQAAVRAYLSACEWRAANYLAEQIQNGKCEETMGENPRIFFLMDGEDVVSFATLTRQDAVDDPALFPWIGFVYTDCRRRGRRYSERVIDHALSVARDEGYRQVYLETDAIGLYEKYGFVYLGQRMDRWGEDSRIYRYSL
jgi:predicted GNAT family N-acyltransferase